MITSGIFRRLLAFNLYIPNISHGKVAKICTTAAAQYSKSRCIDISSQKEAKLKNKYAVLNPKKAEEEKFKKESLICVEYITDLSITKDNPIEQLNVRRARIHQPTKNAMQSGTNNTKHWQIDFETQQRWENPLMSWCSNSDPLSNLHVEFDSVDKAIHYCETTGWDWYIQERVTKKKFKPASYETNFSWNKRIRISTK